jgi:hypothetical protein
MLPDKMNPENVGILWSWVFESPEVIRVLRLLKLMRLLRSSKLTHRVLAE